MLRKTFFAVAAVLVTAVSSQAAIIVSVVQLGEVPGFPQLSHATLRATSDAGETINGIQDPNIVAALGGAGLHQVWTPITNAHTPTRAAQTAAAPLWSDTWQVADSYWLFDGGANSLGVGAAFDETNTPPGAPLPTAGFGAPTTGYGALNTQGGGSGNLGWTLASGKQGGVVDFAHLVGKTGEYVDLNFVVTTNQGTNQTIGQQREQIGIPEPATLSLIGLALAGCIGFIRRR